MQRSKKMKRPTNEQIIERYIKRFEHSRESQINRRSALKYFFQNSGFEKHLFEITKRDLIDYFDKLNQSEDFTIGTKKYRYSILSSLVQFINEYYEEDMDKTIVIPKFSIKWKAEHKESNSNKDVIATKEEIEQILGYLKKGNIRYYLMIRILVETGMRVGELVSIQISNIDLSKRIVKVSGKKGRGAYYFTEDLAKELEYYVNSSPHLSKYLFPSNKAEHYTTKSIQSILSKALKEVGIEKHISAHTFRRSLNTYRFEMLIVNPNDPLNQKDDIRLKILLNHKVEGVNFESYTKLNYKHFLSMYDLLNPYKNLNF